MIKINPEIFRAYDVRGIYPDEINEDVACRIGAAFAQYLKKDLKLKLPFTVVLGLDMRGSSPYLARQVIRGLNDQGVSIVDVGRVPTPAFYHAVAFRDHAAGIMITASHNPKEYNGFKFCGRKASPIGIGSGLEKIRDYAVSAAQLEPVRKPERGKVSSLEGITASYVEQDLSYLNPAKIKKLKIAADTANAMGALYLDELFRRIECEPIKINWELNGNFPAHEANPLKTETLQQLQAIIENEKADFGIAVDGDGDRIAFLDEKAHLIPPHLALGLVAQSLLRKFPGSKIGYDLRSSRAAREIIENAGGEAVETPVGHSNIKKIMKDKDVLFAGELSSHYYFRENYNYESPVFVIAELLLIRSETGKPFSEIWQPLAKYSQSGEINFNVTDKEKVLKNLEKKFADGKVSKLDGLKAEYDNWWFNARPSNTEPVLRLNLEADTEEMMKEKLEEIKKEISNFQ